MKKVQKEMKMIIFQEKEKHRVDSGSQVGVCSTLRITFQRMISLFSRKYRFHYLVIHVIPILSLTKIFYF